VRAMGWEIQTHVVAEILRNPQAAVKNVGVNVYVSEHDIHQPNVTNVILCFNFTNFNNNCVFRVHFSWETFRSSIIF
jgi:hypothetical protein